MSSEYREGERHRQASSCTSPGGAGGISASSPSCSHAPVARSTSGVVSVGAGAVSGDVDVGVDVAASVTYVDGSESAVDTPSERQPASTGTADRTAAIKPAALLPIREQ